MKKRISIVMLMLTICILGACGKEGSVSDNEKPVTVIHAEYPLYDTAQELVGEADLVFSGTVESISYEMLDVRTDTGEDSVTGLSQSQKIPYTIYEVKVDSIYKGDSSETYISIKCPGGEADDSQYIVEGGTILQEGESYLFLTKTYENTYPSLLNATQSTYNMNEPNAVNEDEDKITLSDILDILQ